MINPFRQSQSNKIYNLLTNKGVIVKFLTNLILSIIFFWSFITIIRKTATLKQLKDDQTNYIDQILNVSSLIYKIEVSISRELSIKIIDTNQYTQNTKVMKGKSLELTKIDRSYYEKINQIKSIFDKELIQYEVTKKEKVAIDKYKFHLELRIQQISNEITILHNKIKTIKKNEKEIPFDSFLLNQSYFQILHSMFNNKKNLSLKLLYKPTSINFGPSYFYEAVKDYNHIIVLCELLSEMIIGGYTSKNLNGEGFKLDQDAFLFNLSKGKKYTLYDQKKAIYCSSNFFPIFGEGDLAISLNEVTSDFPNSYGVNNAVRLELTDGYARAFMSSMEVYTIDDSY